AIGPHLISRAVDRAGRVYPPALDIQDRDQVLRAGQDEDVRLVPVAEARQPFVSLARDGREGYVPAEPERPVAGAGIVRQAPLRREARSSRADRQRDGQGSRAGGWVDGELLPDPANRPAPLRKRDLRQGLGGALRRAITRTVAAAGRAGRRSLDRRPVAPWV